MQTVINFINTHIYDFLIPLTALAVLRIAVCLAQLKRTATLREKKGAYHAVTPSYTEIGAWLGVLVFCVFALIVPKIWYLWLVLMVVAGVLVGKAGRKKGAELDDIYRQVAWELKHEAAAEAAREEASHTLESGAEELPEAADTETKEENEDKGETENG